MDEYDNEEDKEAVLKRKKLKDYKVKETFIQFLLLGKPYIRWYIVLITLTLIGSPIGSLLLEANRRFINAAADKNIDLLYTAVEISIAALIIRVILSFLNVYCNNRLSFKSVAGIQKSLLSKLLKTDISALHSYHTGDLIQRINQSAPNAQTGINTRIIDLVRNISQSVILFIYLYTLDHSLALYSLLFACVIPLVLTVRAKLLRELYDRRREKSAALQSFVQDVVIGAETVRTSLLVDMVNKRYALKNNELLQISRRVALIETISGKIRQFMSFIAMLFIIGYGGNLVMRGRLDLGALVVFISSFGRISGPLSGIAGIWALLQQDISNTARVYDVFNLREDSNKGIYSLEHKTGSDLELKHLSYGYNNDKDVIKSMSFVAKTGQITAIVGPSGSGKSTIAKLILGLYTPTSGDICFGNLSLKDIEQESWRKSIAYVPQAPYLFSGSIYENIVCGNLDASESDVHAAAKAARIHEFIMGLKDQYQTSIAERGLSLSGGEKQRIAIARALIRKPLIILLDEPTSSLDSENEAHIKLVVENLIQGRVVIMITHRLTSIIDVDKIVVIEDGQVKEEGSPHDLMAAQGKFHQLYTGVGS